MKLIFAIVNRDDSSIVQEKLLESRFSVTKLATTGGFLRAKSTTFMIGTDEDLVDDAINVIAKYSQKRNQIIPSSGSFSVDLYGGTTSSEITVGGATIFIVDVDRFEKL